MSRLSSYLSESIQSRCRRVATVSLFSLCRHKRRRPLSAILTLLAVILILIAGACAGGKHDRTAEASEIVRTGSIQYNNGDYNGALATFQGLLNDFDLSRDSILDNDYITAHFLLGNIHLAFNDYLPASRYYRQAYRKATSIGFKEREMRLLVNLAAASMFAGDSLTVDEMKSRLAAIDSCDRVEQTYYIRVLTALKEDMFGNKRKGMEKMKALMSYVDSAGMNRRWHLTPLSSVCEYYCKFGPADSAFHYLAMYDATSREFSVSNMMIECKRNYIRLCAQTGDLKGVVNHLDKYDSLMDSLMNPNHFLTLKSGYASALQDESDQKIRSLSMTVSTLHLILAGVGILVLLVALFIFYRYKFWNMNRQLFRRNKEIVEIEGRNSALLHNIETEAHRQPEDLTLTVFATADDGQPVELAEFSYNNGTDGWARHAVSLARFSGNDNIYLDFKAFAVDGSAPIFIDNIRVAQTFANDVELSGISVPAAIDCEANEATVDVSNLGKNPATFTVTLYKNGEAVSTAEVSALPAGESRTLLMDMGIDLTDPGMEIEYRAEAVMDEDEYADNNVSKTVTTLVRKNTLPVVEIEGETDENVVTISWEKPVAKMTMPVTDSFEDYSAYATNNFGEWLTYDGDGCETDFSKFWNHIANAKAAMAFEVWDNSQVEADGFFNGVVNAESYTAHNGDNALIAFTAVEQSWFGDKYPTANDNWLISPLVAGATDVEFFIKGFGTVNPETFEVLYTEDADVNTDDFNTDNFILLGKFSHLGKDWRSVKVTLPADAKRFAIRHTTESNSSGIMIDDVTYTPASGNEKDITAKGYNVYRDGKFIAFVENEEFSEKRYEKGLYIYYVTTLWNEGESAASNKFYAEVENDSPSLGVGSVDGNSASVFAGRGYIDVVVPVVSEVTVTDISGATAFRGKVDDNIRISLEKGVYVVSVDGRSAKVIVR